MVAKGFMKGYKLWITTCELQGGRIDIVGRYVEVVIGKGWRIMGTVEEVEGEWVRVKGGEAFEESEHTIIISLHSVKYIRLMSRG